MNRVYKFQLLPSKSQVVQLEKIDGLLTDFYNYILNWSDEFYQETGKTLKYSVIEKFITTIKNSDSYQEYHFLHTHLLQTTSKRFKRTRENSFRVFRDTKIFNPPKNKKTVKSFCFKEIGNGWKLIGSNKIKFNHITLKFNKHKEIKGEVLYPIIKKEKDGKYYLILVCEISQEILKSSFTDSIKTNTLGIYSDNLKKKYDQSPSEHIGIDLGIKNFITTSDGYVIENPKFYREFFGDILKYQKILDNKLKLNGGIRSKRYEKILILMNERFQKLTNKRNDFIHKVAKYLLITYKSVAIEDLNVSSMMKNKDKENRKDFLKRLLHRELSNIAFGKFISIITLKSCNTEAVVSKIDPRNTTKECNRCNNIVDKELAQRTHSCDKCGLIMDRDLNAAINIFKKAWNKPSESSYA